MCKILDTETENWYSETPNSVCVEERVTAPWNEGVQIERFW